MKCYKKCVCGRTYTREGWKELLHLGTQDGIEYRNCPCKSTLAVEVNGHTANDFKVEGAP